MAWLTGFADGPPVLVRGACDPLAGMHAVVATVLALLSRDADGDGRLVESVMVEAALNAAVEQVAVYATSGELLTRMGNRSRDAAPQGVYPCAGNDAWVALSVTNDAQWQALQSVLGAPAWATTADLATAAGRHANHDDVDKHLAAWTSTRDAAAVVEQLSAAGVPAEIVINARDVVFNAQLQHRVLFEVEHHPITGDHELPGLPFRMTGVPAWNPGPAPTVGEHNAAVFAEIGLDQSAIEALVAGGVAGDRPLGV
jgi:crotonobetainyl-CoA:carnitine CoA-transferase CaiB-like acyl-CoA transferase